MRGKTSAHGARFSAITSDQPCKTDPRPRPRFAIERGPRRPKVILPLPRRLAAVGGVGSSVSVRGFVRIGSTLSVAGASNFGGVVSLNKFASFGSAISVRSFVHMGSALSTYGASRLGSSLSLLDACGLGSSSSVRSFARLGSSASMWGALSLGSPGALLHVIFQSRCTRIPVLWVLEL